MNNLKHKFRRFMTGRYGTDELNRFILTIVLAMVICNLFTRTPIFIYLELLFLFFTYFRTFSKNTSARFKENQTYLNLRFRAQENIKKLKPRLEEARKYKIFKCPDCGQKLRIPRGHGKISIHCRKCGRDFMGKS